MSLPRYPEYKDSGVSWLGEVPAHWSLSRVKSLFAIGRGRVISQEDLIDSGEYPVFSSQTKDDGCLGYIDTYDFDRTHLTWTTDGANAGTVFLRSGKHNCTNVCGTLFPREDTVFLKYGMYFLQFATQFYKRPDTNGAKIMNAEMAEVLFALPDAIEQRAIAVFLDRETAKIDALIAEQEKLIALLAEKRQATISRAVTSGLDPNVPLKDSGVPWLGKVPAHWEVKALRRVVSLNPSKSEVAHFPKDSEVSFLPMEAIGENGDLILDRFRKLSEVETGYTYFRNGDVTIAKITPCFENGKGGVMTGLLSGFGFGTTELIVVRPNLSFISSDYLNCIFKSKIFRSEGEGSMYGAGGQKRVSDDFVRNLFWAIPPASEQLAIERFINTQSQQFELLKSNAQTAISLLKERRAALISAAVTGKIDVRGLAA